MRTKSQFFTLQGYRIKNNVPLTEAMEDYLEMIYRNLQNHKNLSVTELAIQLNVKPSSVSKMLTRLKNAQFISYQKYGMISLTSLGQQIGYYLLYRHNLLTSFFQILNKNDYDLEQVEKIEHFIDDKTLKHIEQFLKENKI